MEWNLQNPRKQTALDGEPYDRWITPQGVCMAEFYRKALIDGGQGYLVRFPGQADFTIQNPGDTEVEIFCHPVPEHDPAQTSNLFHNQILPILGNHAGGLFLHGSAVRMSDVEGSKNNGAVAFLGLSRGGKTTLAGSFAKAGFAFLTEDVIDLRHGGGKYWLQPKRSKLRLFADSAQHLLGPGAQFDDDNRKQDVEAGEALPFAKNAEPLRQIYILGTDHGAPLSIRRLGMSEALSALLPHAFILDVEDKTRLRGHFSRMADLSQDISCYALDYRREYAELPRVQEAVLSNLRSEH